MDNFTTIFQKASSNPKLMAEIIEILDVHFDMIEVEHPALYWKTINEIYILENGFHFNDECAKYAVSCMMNEDGTSGEHWSPAETSSVASSSGVMFDVFNMYDWYYVLNMMYSDYFKTIGTNVDMYIKLANDWLRDKDAPEGKAFRYWRMIKGY